LQKEDAAKEALKKSFSVLDKVLQSRTFLVGHAVTLADVILTCILAPGFKNVFDAPFRADFPSLVRYFETVANQPTVAKVLGAAPLCDKVLTYSPPGARRRRPPAPAAHAPAAAGKKAEAKPAEAPKPKAPKKADDDEEDDGPDGVEAEKPKKDPLNDLPKSKMVLDSWKRLYSNTPAAQFKTVCAAGLWAGADIPNSPTNEHFEGFDAEGYSLWFIEHMFPEEQTVQYRALNAVSGFFQRCDYARKHAFAVVSILQDKAAGTFPIQGFWIFRGQEVNWQMKEECPDLEVYKLTKCVSSAGRPFSSSANRSSPRADPNDPAVRARVEAFICEDEVIGGLTNMEAKVFK